MRPKSPSRNASRAALALLALLGATPAGAQPGITSGANQATPQPHPGNPRPEKNHFACPPGTTSAACEARRRTLQPALPVAPRPHPVPVLAPARPHYNAHATRFVPPSIIAFLNSPQIEPQVRAFLMNAARIPTEEWTLQEYQTVVAVVPTLAERYIPTAVLSDFYDFLGLDPKQLFNPKLGQNWQKRSETGFDARNYDATQRAQCLYLLGAGENPDPSSVTLKQLAACSADKQ